MRFRVLSRASALAVLQARTVAAALRARWPDLDVQLATRASEGDRNRDVPLAQAVEKGLFTADLSAALLSGEAEAVVHSWKDLPIEPRPGTFVAGTLERADPRDVLLVRREAIDRAPDAFPVLTSSPRRAWQLEQSIRDLMPWPVSRIDVRAVRGNIPTRVRKLVDGDADALVVAKAALDRLLSDADPAGARDVLREALARCRWMVLPIREFPTAPAQGALAIEVAAARTDVVDRVRAIDHAATATAVAVERRILAGFGGGCHEAIGATVLLRDYGTIRSVRGLDRQGRAMAEWSLEPVTPLPPPASAETIWPRPDERAGAVRRPIAVDVPVDRDLWIARADALPEGTRPRDGQLVWAAGTRTWRRLASRGVWVNGCTEGLGDAEAPRIEALAGRSATWLRLTHAGSDAPASLATYEVDHRLPPDLAARTHFFWTSASAFLAALEAVPAIRSGWHASGPGRTARVIRDTLGSPDRVSIWLDYEQWHAHLTR